MIRRTNNDKCLLCRINTAIRPNSHIVPSSLLEDVHGTRNKEHSFIISSCKTSIDEYFGRQYPQEYSTEIKSPNFTCDYILCDECEKFIGSLENRCSPLLKSIDNEDNNKFKNLSINNILTKEIHSLNAELIQVCFYSIIWRLIISNYIDQGSFEKHIIIIEESLRNLIIRFKANGEEQCNEISSNKHFHLLVVTTKQPHYAISQFFDSSSDNPYFFIAGRFILYLIDLVNINDDMSFAPLLELERFANDGIKKFLIVYLPNDNYAAIIDKVFNSIFSKIDINKLNVMKKEISRIINQYI